MVKLVVRIDEKQNANERQTQIKTITKKTENEGTRRPEATQMTKETSLRGSSKRFLRSAWTARLSCSNMGIVVSPETISVSMMIGSAIARNSASKNHPNEASSSTGLPR